MKKATIILLIVSGACSIVSSHSFARTIQQDERQARDRSLPVFSKIENNTSVDLEIVTGKSNEIMWDGGQTSNQYYLANVIDGKLVITVNKENKEGMKPKAKAVITCTNLNMIINNGSGNVTIENKLKGDKLAIEMNGSGNIDAAVDVEKLTARQNGSGNLYIKGEAAQVYITSNGSGGTETKNLKAQKMDVTHNGSGKISIDSNAELNIINNSNMDDISIKGNVDSRQVINRSKSLPVKQKHLE